MTKTKIYAAFVVAGVLSLVQASAQVSGSGTIGTVPVWVGTTKLGNSPIVQSGANVAIGTKTAFGKLHVQSTSKTQPAVIGNITATTGTAPGGFHEDRLAANCRRSIG